MFKLALFSFVPFLAFACPIAAASVLAVGAFCLLWPDTLQLFKQDIRDWWALRKQEPLYIEIAALIKRFKAYWLRRLHVWNELPIFQRCRAMCL